MLNNRKKITNTVKICFLICIEAIFCFTPLGSIPIGPIVATLSMIPVIITSLTFGKKVGMILGFTMATFSFIYWTFIMPAAPTAFIFTPFSEFVGYKGNIGSLIICFVPRVLTGYIPDTIKKISSNGVKSNIQLSVASICGSLTNTILVLGFIMIFFGKEYSTIVGKNILFIIGTTVLTNGIPEAIVSAIVCPLVYNAIKDI